MRKILIIKQTSLGDILHSTVSLGIIKENFPDSEITFMVGCVGSDIVRFNPLIKHIIFFDFQYLMKIWKKNIFKAIIYYLKKIYEVRKYQYDYIFDLQGLSRTVIFAYFGRAEHKITKANFPFIKSYKNKKIHAIEEIVNLLKFAGLRIPQYKMDFFIPNKAKRKVIKLLSRIRKHNEKVLLISPFTRWQSKNWGLDNYYLLIKILKERFKKKKIIIIFTGTAKEETLIEQIIENQKNISLKFYNMFGSLSIIEYGALVLNSDLLLSSDGFPVHCASALNIPVIAIFGPTDETRVGPLNSNSYILRDHSLKCQKCYKQKCNDKKCMHNIKPKMIADKIEVMLYEKK